MRMIRVGASGVATSVVLLRSATSLSSSSSSPSSFRSAFSTPSLAVGPFRRPEESSRRWCACAATTTNDKDDDDDDDDDASPRFVGERTRRVGVVGGGLAGLSVAYHLSRKDPRVSVSILDECASGPGSSGASAVAGGLLHPFSPSGRLVHLGERGLATTAAMVDEASRWEDGVVLRDGLLRLASSERQEEDLRRTARERPDLATWYDRERSTTEASDDLPPSVRGSLWLAGGCRVVHVPSYLRGLLAACGDAVTWEHRPGGVSSLDALLSEKKERGGVFDEIVLCAGAGTWRSGLLPPLNGNHGDDDGGPFSGTTLVRGRSLLLQSSSSRRGRPVLKEALLCGKYAAPTPDPDVVLVGATHEFRETEDDDEESFVRNELRRRTRDSHPRRLWEDDDFRVAEVTDGWRVQTRRSARGRLPVAGRLDLGGPGRSCWTLTGLSSRGLVHHGVYGDLLTDAVMEYYDDEPDDDFQTRHPHLGRWSIDDL